MTDRLVRGILAALTMLLILIAVFSLQWRMVHDTPVMLYLSFLIDRFHEVPYRDFFDENAPGVYLTYYIVGRVFGYSDLGFRCADMLYLAAILAATWLWVKGIDRRAGWCGALLFGLVYLGRGPVLSFQKDYVILLPTALALLVSSRPRFNAAVRSALIGFLFGACALVKPQAAIGLPLVLAFMVFDGGGDGRGGFRGAGRLIGAASSALAGFAVPLAAAVLYLWRNGALGSFIDIARNYWPLYHELTGYKAIARGYPRMQYLFWNYTLLGGGRIWLVPAAIGTGISLIRSGLTVSQRRQVALLICLTVCYSLYVPLAGKFWPYHWLPFSYFIILLSSLCLIPQPSARPVAIRIVPAIALILTACLAIHMPSDFVRQIHGQPPEVPQGGRVDEIASYLRSHLRPGDKVQPIEGCAHAMLLAEAELATPIYYDTCFCHHLSSPYIQGLRSRFISDLATSKPRFITRVSHGGPGWIGPDTSAEFPELQSLIDSEYHAAARGRGYVIYERNAPAEAGAP